MNALFPFDNSYVRLPDRFFARIAPTPVEAPRLVRLNRGLAEELGLDNVTVLRARAEDVTEQFDIVTARAVAALEKLARWCMPLVKPGGYLLALKGRSAADEVNTARRTLNRLHAGDIVVTTYGEAWDLEVPTTVVEVQRRR